ncbi:MAG: hypothetical protein B6244_00080 [Candidatus Cloacimonetes bacterium 4572_55]|nr:MAG: hypothetical protein B6244_00080 [Candidatus Cloacimonetes bacterium 4572_55]
MLRFGLIVLLTLLLAASAGFSEEDAAKDAQLVYKGAKGCKCHNGKMSEKGAEKSSLAIWKAGPHAKAYESLGTDEAKALVEEGKNPQEMDECLRCHVTGHGIDVKYHGKKYDKTDGIWCETCHGAGENYFKMKVMKAISAGEKDGAELGLVKPTEELCVTCHNEESPTFKEFKFEESVKKITHPIMGEAKKDVKSEAKEDVKSDSKEDEKSQSE